MINGIIRQFVIFDEFLLDACFQPFSDWMRNHTGNSCFWIGKWTIRILFAVIAGSVMWIAREAYVDPVRLPLFVSISTIACLIQPHVLFRLSTFLDENEERLIEELESARVANPYRLKFADRRFSGVLYSILTWPMVALSLLLVREATSLAVSLQLLLSLFTVSVYFLSCTPKPRARKRKERIALSPL